MRKMRYQIGGQYLRELREKLGLTVKDVEAQSRHLAEKRKDSYALITAASLSQIENSNSLPDLCTLTTLSEIYRISYADQLRLYGWGIEMAA